MKRDGKTYVELPEDLQDKKITAIRISKELILLGSSEAIRELVERQTMYLLRGKLAKKIVRSQERQKDGGSGAPDKRTSERQVRPSSGEFKYAIIRSEAEAKSFQSKHYWEFKKGQIRGVKGFDGNYYVMNTDFYQEAISAIERALQGGEKTVEELAAETGLPKDAVKVAVVLAGEDGIVYEKPDGKLRWIG